MVYQDPIYGRIDFPNFVEELINTPEMQRLRGISQDVLPQSCVPWRISDRLGHSLGVGALGIKTLKRNRLPERNALLLLVGALLHDAGNGPLSHLSEPFLRRLTGKDGESFLSEMLIGTPTAGLIKKIGVSPESIVRLVTGDMQPFSLILNGSMDIDNLDNVLRYWFTTHDGEVRFDAPAIASSCRFSAKSLEWELLENCLEEARKWQLTREAVYAMVYDQPHQNACAMIYRALYLAFVHGQILEFFFRFTDTEALNFLRHCNPESKHLVERVLSAELHEEVFSFATANPNAEFKRFADGEDARSLIADYVAVRMRVPPSAVCAYVGRGRDKRRIALPFVGKDGQRFFDDHADHPIYRMKVYVHPDFMRRKEEVVRLARRAIG